MLITYKSHILENCNVTILDESTSLCDCYIYMFFVPCHSKQLIKEIIEFDTRSNIDTPYDLKMGILFAFGKDETVEILPAVTEDISPSASSVWSTCDSPNGSVLSLNSRASTMEPLRQSTMAQLDRHYPRWRHTFRFG